MAKFDWVAYVPKLENKTKCRGFESRILLKGTMGTTSTGPPDNWTPIDLEDISSPRQFIHRQPVSILLGLLWFSQNNDLTLTNIYSRKWNILLKWSWPR